MSTLANYLQVIDRAEAPQHTAVFYIGEMNPPTAAHGKLISKAVALAEEVDGDHFVIPVQDSSFPSDVKMAFMREMFPHANIVEDVNFASSWNVPEWLAEQGYTDIYAVVGSDDLEDTSRLMETFTGYFDKFEAVTIDQRNPDNDVVGMNSVRARHAAQANDIGAFRVATGWTGERAARLMEVMRITMGMVE